MSPSKPHRVSYVEEVNEDTGSVIEGTERYAVSEAPSPSKEKPNTGKSRKDRSSRRPPSSSPPNGLTDSDSTVHPISSSRREKESGIRAKERSTREKERIKDKDRERAKASKKVAAVRPVTKHSKTTPVLHSQSQQPPPRDAYRRPTSIGDDASFYGVSPSPGHRPRALTSRPTSYYGPGSRPPLANAQWHPGHAPSSVHAPPPPLAPVAYGAPSVAPYPGQSSPTQPQPGDYFGSSAVTGPQHQHLAQRFQRPSSAMGYRSTSSSSYGFEDHEQENDPVIARRPSITKKHRDDEDRRRMPPPPRPVSAAPRQAAIRPPPPRQQPRRTVAFDGFDDADFEGDDSSYRDISTRSMSYGYGDGAILPRNRRGSITYDSPAYRIEPAGNTRRRHSYYGSGGGVVGSLDYEDKFRAAAAYQNDTSGGPTMPLTAETLRKAGKRTSDKSSRSTRSSDSRDESDWRQSNTTRTTRSSAGDDDITIKVTGSATLKVGGAEIQCQDGGEINITQQGTAARLIGAGSDRGSSIYGDDRRSRMDRLPIRTRASSQAASWTRSPPAIESYGRPAFL